MVEETDLKRDFDGRDDIKRSSILSINFIND